MRNPLGVVSCHLAFDTLEAAFVQAARHGLQSIEWFDGAEPRYSEPDAAARVCALAGQYGIASGYHGPYLGAWALGALEPATARARAVDLVERADRLGARLLTVHLGHHRPEQERTRALDTAIGAIEVAAIRAQQLGVVIAVENFTRCHSPYDLGDTVAELDTVLQRLPAPVVGLTLDTGHAAITGTLPEILERFGSRLVNTHLHDNDGRADGHWPPGKGLIDWDWLLGAFERIGYTGPWTFEFPEASGCYPQFTARLRQRRNRDQRHDP